MIWASARPFSPSMRIRMTEGGCRFLCGEQSMEICVQRGDHHLTLTREIQDHRVWRRAHAEIANMLRHNSLVCQEFNR